MAHDNGLLGFDLTLSNACNYSAMQFDMLLPSEVKIHDVRAVSMSDHIVSFRELGNGLVRVVLTSFSNHMFSPGNLLNVLVRVSDDTHVNITNAWASTSDGRIVKIADTVFFNSATGINIVDALAAPADIYDMSGRLVMKSAVTTEKLPKGVYLINGRKVVK
jgi:hypothetical protein